MLRSCDMVTKGNYYQKVERTSTHRVIEKIEQDGYDAITVSEKTLDTSEITGSFIVIVRACLAKKVTSTLNSKERAPVSPSSSARLHDVYLGL